MIDEPKNLGHQVSRETMLPPSLAQVGAAVHKLLLDGCYQRARFRFPQVKDYTRAQMFKLASVHRRRPHRGKPTGTFVAVMIPGEAPFVWQGPPVMDALQARVNAWEKMLEGW